MLWILILDKIVVFLVDGIICQVHVFVVLVEFGCVGFGSKSCEALFVNIDSQGFVAGDNYVNSQVEFVAIDEKGICYIPGNDT